MTTSTARLYLISPPISDADSFAPLLLEACRAGDIAAVCLSFTPADERTHINRIKALSPIAQEAGTAVLISATPPKEGEMGQDWPMISARGGADGVHIARCELDALADMRERMNEGRILGIGDLRARHDAMEAGELGVDYVMFGEPDADGTLPPLTAVLERAQWWAELFHTPCVAYAHDMDALEQLATTGVEFIALGSALFKDPEKIAQNISLALSKLDTLSEPNNRPAQKDTSMSGLPYVQEPNSQV